jgi:acyl-CoA thioester hydrolase
VHGKALHKGMVTFSAEYRAQFSDTDAAGIIHFSTIFFWVEATEEALFRSLQIPFLKSDGAKLSGYPRVRVECDYLSPIHREEVVTVQIKPIEISDKKLVWGFSATVQNRPVAQGTLTTVYAWREGQGPMAAALIPLDVKNALQRHFKI